MRKPPFFIIGNPRSGTTLLRLMLMSHPRLCVPQEAGFTIHLLDKYADFNGDFDKLNAFLQDLEQSPKFEHWNLDQAALKTFLADSKPKNYAELINDVFACYSECHLGERQIWGEKNNFYLHCIPKIAGIFPAAKFVHIIRDGRDVACSYRDMYNLDNKYAPKLPRSIVQAAKHWRNNIQKIGKALGNLGKAQFLEIRYEDLVDNAEAVLSKICTFLGVAYDEKMLDYHQEKNEKIKEPQSYSKWKALNNKEVVNTRIGRWKKSMFEEDIALFEYMAKPTLKKYNYPLSGLKLDKLKLLKALIK